MRNPNGTGSVFKEKGNRTRPWRAMVTLGYDENGKNKRKSLGYYKTKIEANAAIIEFYNNPNNFINMPTLEILYNRFTSTLSGKSKSTQDMYKTSWKYFAEIKDEEIKNIKSIHIQDIIDNLINEEGLGYSTVHKVKLLASQLCKLAMQDDYINKNYADFVVLPKKPIPDNRIFTLSEINRIEEFANINDWAKIILIMIYTATRPGELLSVTKFNVNLDENYLIGGMKTDAGRDRYIPIHSKIIKHVKYFYSLSKSEYLITNNGFKVHYRHFLDRYYEVLDELNVQKLSPHKCRKTGATLYHDAGIDQLTLQRLLGHADFSTTSKYYIADDNKKLQDAIKLLSAT